MIVLDLDRGQTVPLAERTVSRCRCALHRELDRLQRRCPVPHIELRCQRRPETHLGWYDAADRSIAVFDGSHWTLHHEYGHAVWFTRDHGLTEADYIRIRGYPAWVDGSDWRERAAEIIANDFRRIVCGTIDARWPHDVPQLGADSPIGAWWMQITTEGMR